MNKRYKPLIDKMYFIIMLPTAAVLISALVISAYAPMMFFVTVPSTLFTAYFFVSPLFGYVELGEEWVFIKYGFFMKKVIPYDRIRRVTRGRKFISESMMSLKFALEHVEIRYNRYDVPIVSVVENDEFAKLLWELCEK